MFFELRVKREPRLLRKFSRRSAKSSPISDIRILRCDRSKGRLMEIDSGLDRFYFYRRHRAGNTDFPFLGSSSVTRRCYPLLPLVPQQ